MARAARSAASRRRPGPSASTSTLGPAPETTAAVTDLVGQDALGNDLVGVRGLPTVGEPTIETGPVTDLLPAGTV